MGDPVELAQGHRNAVHTRVEMQWHPQRKHSAGDGADCRDEPIGASRWGMSLGFDLTLVDAAYGGVFFALPVRWGWRVDGIKPDVATVIGAAICLVGVGVIMYWPHRG